MVTGLGLSSEKIDICIDNCMIYWRKDAELLECKFCKKPRYKAQGSGSGRNRVSYQRMWYLPITYINLKRLQQRWDGMQNILRRKARTIIPQMQKRGNTWIRCTLILQTTFAMFILGCAQMALVILECLEGNTRFGQSSWCHTTFHQRCVWKGNSFSWVYWYLVFSIRSDPSMFFYSLW